MRLMATFQRTMSLQNLNKNAMTVFMFKWKVNFLAAKKKLKTLKLHTVKPKNLQASWTGCVNRKLTIFCKQKVDFLHPKHPQSYMIVFYFIPQSITLFTPFLCSVPI